MLPYRDSRIVTIAVVLFFVLAALYAYYETRGLIFGPRIELGDTPQEVREPYILITGKAERISSLSMQGKNIPVTEEGFFEEPYLLSPGLNRIVLEAEDRYGRTRSTVFQIVYTPGETTSTEAGATSSSASTRPAQTGDR